MNARAKAYLIGLRDLNPGWVPLYVATLALQYFCAATRLLIVVAVLWVLDLITDWGVPVNVPSIVVGFGPPALSIATLILPLGGWLMRQQEGGRGPSEREKAVFEAAMSLLREADPKLRGPRRWFVIDDPTPNASAYADTLIVTRSMLESTSFPAVLAHELGHLNSSDARVTAALYRMTTPPRQPIGFPFRLIAFLAGGRAAMSVMRTPWAIYWRRREQIADRYAAKLGQGPALAGYLDTHALAGDLPTPFKDFGDTSHPWTEHRIDELEGRQEDS